MRDYATTGDMRYLLAVQRHLTAVQDESGDTALHLAVINSQQEVVQCLIDIMAGMPESYVSEYNFLRQPPVDYHFYNFFSHFMIPVCFHLPSHPLHLAAITRQPRILDCSVKSECKCQITQIVMETLPLHIACMHGDAVCLTPVHLAVLAGSKDVLKLLNSSGATMSAQDGTCGRTPLHHAVEQDNLAVAGFLILEMGNTPLHIAAASGLKGPDSVASGCWS
ncbi:Nuclear factor NF-kappa-B p105 subunit [Desmophyllum pertusum]|uniref:Nuclear factor NF-kappa-B p105 subunit n=1 Tax=Desmophyllum pertusum TaxID=174260 RepID=A0A9X0CZT6_9CNID|nr:Nuclear factor NF-kappa-B p105 subunit [Desmophyllum pertusum]